MSESQEPARRSTGPAYRTEGEGLSLWSSASVVLRHWRVVVVAPAVVAFIVAVGSLFSPRRYVARAAFVPQEPPTAQSGLGELARQFGLAAPRANASSPQFYADLLVSREVLRDVVLTSYALGSGRDSASNLVRYFGIGTSDTDAAVMLAIGRVRRLLDIRTDRNTGVVTFEVRTELPALSARIVSRLLELVNNFDLQRRHTQARAEREFVDQRLALADSALTRAEESLSEFYRRNRRFSDSPELQAEDARLKRQVDLRQQLYVTLSQNREAAKIEELRSTPVITVLERPEAFVEPVARGTITKTIVAFVAAAFLALGLAFLMEYSARARDAGTADYREFVSLWRAMVANRVARVQKGPGA
jgi:uncharacterized protein involved in exopolysaccharide biosynthesis